MVSFEQYGGGKRDFDFRVGPVAEESWNCAEFADRLWGDVMDILGVPALGGHRKPDGASGYRYSVDSDAMLVTMFVDDDNPGFPWEKVPAMLTPWSRSETLENWQMAEHLYTRLDDLGRYLLIVFEEGGMPIASNFDIGDDW
ncbi:hypothetical protein [Streptomyces sp. N35]|uniref:hypothetical protein n=1 Tax=Streptomyces sp. N35 TaxID=2795730 RepID=UPI0018F6F2CF|nr:hypothetical protein [Streptomyces sp. N35]